MGSWQSYRLSITQHQSVKVLRFITTHLNVEIMLNLNLFNQ